ncbi:nuclease-related domain-containing protein [Pseudonocardia charpentierae]|uniref:Nuclease-related domain-containing protein n=1 Tax=Pseudonocardia charpentierae TaxID=3075545 RepID=A0ABU2NDW2_9PSEU|nr:nuclease-related domain-containing protein [Pseudonocardia sp. DSM 45834]MDT0351658.1 nuclease-related domain-containing protein [Pseudonocardia sp. DSM 45834]
MRDVTGSNGTGDEGWVDLARNLPGIEVTPEEARRRAEEAGRDPSSPHKSDSKSAIGDLLATLTEPSRWDRWRGRTTGWFVLHSVPLGDGSGGISTSVDHLVVGPPGVMIVNSEDYRPVKRAPGDWTPDVWVRIHRDGLEVDGHQTEYMLKVRREALRVAGFLLQALVPDRPDLVGRVPVQSVVVIVGGQFVVGTQPSRVTMLRSIKLLDTLRGFPAVLDHEKAAAVYAIARRAATWNPIGWCLDSMGPGPDRRRSGR